MDDCHVSVSPPLASPPPLPPPQLLPGMVNAHTHSIEQWGRGVIKPMPLELWVTMLYQHLEPRGPGGAPNCPSRTVYLSALHLGVETLMTGATAIMDHLWVAGVGGGGAGCIRKELTVGSWVCMWTGGASRYCRDLEDVGAAVAAYKQLGLRAYIAP